MDKVLYKTSLLSLKIIPWFLAIIYLIGTIFASCGIDLLFLSAIGYTSVIPACFIILSSFTFKFCIWHRIPLYFVLLNNIINWIVWVRIGVFSCGMLIVTILLTLGIISIAGAFYKNKRNEQIRNIQKQSSANNK